MSTGKAITVINPDKFIVNMPDEAPALGFDPLAADFSWQAVYPANYWNLEDLEARIQDIGGNPVYTPARISIEPVIDPEDKTPDLSPKVVIYFEELCPKLVLNRTRCSLAEKFTGTRNPQRWAELLGPIELYPGVARDFSMSQQILFRPVGDVTRNGSTNGAGKTVVMGAPATEDDDVPF
jgi:hypothetical protein